MKQTINKYQFRDAFERMGRKENFSYAGLEVLFDYLESLESDIGEELELDVIAICCDYSEDKIENVLKEHNLDSLDELKDNTIVLEVDDETIIYHVY